MRTGSLTDRTGRIPVGPSWLVQAWRASRVAIGASIAEAAVVWLGIEALSNASAGTIPLGPVIVAMLLIGVVPAWSARLRGVWLRLSGLLTVVVAALVLIRSLSFPSAGWLDDRWLRSSGDSLLFHDADAAMPVWVPILVVVGGWWWRQRRSANATDDVRTSLRFGAIALIILAMIGAFTGMATQGEIATAGTVFFAAILLAMSWAREAAVHPGELSGGNRVTALTSLGGVAIILVVATALVAVVNPAAFDTLLWVLTPVFWLIRLAILGVSGLLLVVAYPFFWVFQLLADRGVFRSPSSPETAMPSPQPSDALDSATAQSSLPDPVRVVLAAVILTAIVLLIVRQALRRTPVATAPSDVEQHIEMDLRSLLRRRRRGSQAEPDPLAGMRGDERFRNTVAIREIYAWFLRTTADAGLARVRPETARHHARRVAEAIGSPVEDIWLLSELYGTIRYDEAPATADQLHTVTAAWERVAPRLQDRERNRTDHPAGRARARHRA